jgi:hypothetical protein
MIEYKVGQKARIHWPSGWHGDVDGVIISLGDGTKQLEVRDGNDQRAWWELAWEDDREVILLDPMSTDELLGAPESDPVNSPSHYTAYPVEVIVLTECMSFSRGNAVKYIARAGLKGGPETEIEDLKKARWYIEREIKRLEHTDGSA